MIIIVCSYNAPVLNYLTLYRNWIQEKIYYLVQIFSHKHIRPSITDIMCTVYIHYHVEQ